MESRNNEEELKEYQKHLNEKGRNSQIEEIIAKNDLQETLSNSEHKMLIEDCSCDELLGIYDDLKDLELADLCDFFNMERGDGRI